MGNINNINLLAKISLKIVIFLMGFWSFLGYVDAATIESTSTGGNWSSPTTWIGGVVPGINDKAIINGNIIFSTNINVGELEISNNGTLTKMNISIKYVINVLGKTINNGTIGGFIGNNSENVRFNLQNGLVNNGYIFGVNEIYLKGEFLNNGTINQNINLLGDTTINGTFYHGKVIVLNGYTLNIPKDSYIYGISGTGNIYSSTSNNGNNEKIYIARILSKINTNFEYLNISEAINSINGRNIIITGNIAIISSNSINITGNLIINEGARITKYDSTYNYSLYLSGNFENNGNYGGNLINNSNNSSLHINGSFKNKGTIQQGGYIYINKGFDNISGSILSTGMYITWEPISGHNTYEVNIENIGSYKNGGTRYGMSTMILTGNNLYLKWRPYSFSAINNYEWSEKICINVSGCVPDIITNTGPSQYNPNNSQTNNSNQNTSQNISSGHLVFDISNLKVKIDAAEKLAKQSEDTSKGDPVILNTGEFDYENTLMSYAGVNLPFEFKIKYKNQSYYNGPIGNNFDYNYNIYLTQDESGNINIHDGKLGVFKFTSSGSTFERNETIKANLELINNKYEISFDDKTKYVFGDNFKIEKIIDTYGNNLSFEYNNDRQLVKITDTLNREYNLSYYGHSRLYKIIDFAGNEVEFIYFNENETNGSQFDLKTIKMINGNSEKEISFTYTIGSDFESSHNIVKLIDSANNTYVENTYDSSDRVSSQTYGNGTIYYNYTVNTNNKITKNSVTDREGNVIDYYYDNFGNTTQKVIKKTNGDLEYNYEYDLNNNLIKETKPLGNGVLYNYDVNNNIIEKRLVQDTTSSGSINDIVINYTYDLNTNKPTQIVEPNGLITNLVYDTNNNLVSKEVIGVKDYNGTDISINESFTYNGSGQLVSQTNALGLETSFEYNSGNLTKIYKPHPNPLLIGEGITTEFSYDSKGNITSITDGEGNITNLSYDDFNLLISKTTSEGIVNEIIYNSLNKKTSEKIVLGASDSLDTSYNYDILDNLTQSISEIDSGVNLITNYTYDTNSRIIETSTGSGAVENYIYDENGLILSKTISYENNDVTTNYTYDLNERLIKQINPNNSEINFEYDLFDRIIKKIDINGSYTIYTYDKSNNITKQEIYSSNDVLIGKQEFVYDKQNRVIETKNHKLPNDIIISKTKYDSLGNTIKTIDGKGNETNYNYDIFSRLIQVEDSLGNKVQNSYDKNDNLIEKKIISSTNKTIATNYTYDSDNRLVSETNNLNKTKTYTYNKLNQVTSITDEEGNITNYTYTYTGKVKTDSKVTNSGNLTTSYTYDQMGNMTSVIDSEGNITNYEYDSLNRLVKQIYADEKEVNYVYDINNNLVQKTDPNGTIINYTYDSQNRLISKNITNGVGIVGITSETYSYDELGRMIEANDSNNHKLEFSYDSLGRLITETQSGSLVSYDYDNNNNLTSINDVNYTYDNLNRITNIGYNSNNVATYNYTGLENTSIIYENNTSIIKGYDSLSRINSLNNGVNNYNYTYDYVNNITSDSIKNYLYDDIYRLINVNETNSGTLLESFNYDDIGNRINSFNINTGSGASFDYETNILNQYTSLSGSISSYELQEIIEEIQTGSGTTETITTYTGSIVTTNENTSFVYDNNGNLKNNGTFEFSYDYKNRLTKVETGSGIIAQYSYDVLNRRSILRQGYEGQVKETKYIYSNENILSEITTDETTNITTTKNYINGIGLDDLIAYEENNDIYFYHKNHLGSVEGISDNLGNIVVSYEYDSFGNFEITSGTDNGNTRLYTGREYDAELKLYYNRARYYNPELGRFISRDPIDIADDVNLYAYVGNNSLNYVDLMGTEGKPLTPPKTAAEHYARNVLNVDLPETYSDAIKQKWILLDESKSVYHNSNAPIFSFNKKFISPDGHKEAVYDYKTGKIITSPEDMGTYNYYSPLTDSDLHREFDVEPYFIWGNSEDDTTNIAERLLKSGNYIPAKINEKEANIKYRVNNFNQIDFINNFIKYAR